MVFSFHGSSPCISHNLFVLCLPNLLVYRPWRCLYWSGADGNSRPSLLFSMSRWMAASSFEWIGTCLLPNKWNLSDLAFLMYKHQILHSVTTSCTSSWQISSIFMPENITSIIRSTSAWLRWVVFSISSLSMSAGYQIRFTMPCLLWIFWPINGGISLRVSGSSSSIEMYF